MTDLQPKINNRLKGRLTMLAIIAVFVLPFFILPLFMSPEQMSKTNKGVLLQPSVAFADLYLRDMNNVATDVSALNKKWSMAYVVPAICGVACVSARNNALYSMRQVRVSLQRDMDRVQSLLIFTAASDEPLTALLNKEFPAMLQMQASSEALDKQIAKASSAGNIYLISPDGYIFMYYPPYENAQSSLEHADDIKADLKKSIKGSRL